MGKEDQRQQRLARLEIMEWMEASGASYQDISHAINPDQKVDDGQTKRPLSLIGLLPPPYVSSRH